MDRQCQVLKVQERWPQNKTLLICGPDEGVSPESGKFRKTRDTTRDSGRLCFGENQVEESREFGYPALLCLLPRLGSWVKP
jgi:hypothetical protein